MDALAEPRCYRLLDGPELYYVGSRFSLCVSDLCLRVSDLRKRGGCEPAFNPLCGNPMPDRTAIRHGGGPVLGTRLESRGGACPKGRFSCASPRFRAHVPCARPGGCVFADDLVQCSWGLGGCLPQRAAQEVDGCDLIRRCLTPPGHVACAPDHVRFAPIRAGR